LGGAEHTKGYQKSNGDQYTPSKKTEKAAGELYKDRNKSPESKGEETRPKNRHQEPQDEGTEKTSPEYEKVQGLKQARKKSEKNSRKGKESGNTPETPGVVCSGKSFKGGPQRAYSQKNKLKGKGRTETNTVGLNRPRRTGEHQSNIIQDNP